jgi:mono/diheme cytochrome c family protein
MRVFLLITAISVGSAVFASSVSSASSASSVSSATSQSPNVATLYRVHCVMCHGPMGKAAIPTMAFIGRKWKHGTKSADMVKVITDGVKGTPMMSFKGKLKADEIKALAAHVRSFDKTLPPEK